MAKFLKKFRWLYPGIKIKRWIFLTVLGVGILVFGAVRFFNDEEIFLRILDIGGVVLGAGLIIGGIRSMLRSLLSLFPSFSSGELLDIVYKKRFLEKGPKVVAIGGGHGLSTLLSGLKEYTTNLIAIVTVADSGGSSGRLRQEFDVLPPGDIRNCLVSLADSPSLMGELFQYRFKEDSELKGHNFGNLFITAMTQLTGDFKRAIEESSKVLAIRGRVLPSTLNKVSLIAEYQDGSLTEGEAEIPKKKRRIKKVYLKSLDAQRRITPTLEAIEAIKSAQVIVIGPGSLYTSILPNLVIKEITQAVVESPGLKIYVCNVMTQPGETDGFSASEHVKVLLEHTHPRILDYCILNTRHPPSDLLKRYAQEGAYPVRADTSVLEKMGYQVIEGEFLHATDFIRHDPAKLAKVIIELLHKESLGKII
ncbi:MAG: YvcK family protein [Candidatus Omnitrophica bacterium]|nr:YvcK family protein [Candidatus Omnitrophota bacterium]